MVSQEALVFPNFCFKAVAIFKTGGCNDVSTENFLLPGSCFRHLSFFRVGGYKDLLKLFLLSLPSLIGL